MTDKQSKSSADARPIPGLDAKTSAWICRNANQISVCKGTQVFNPGDPCANFLIVTKGTIKVHQLSESGKEIVLYRVQQWESCLLTTACLLAQEQYSVSAVAETDVEAIALPASVFNQGMEQSSAMRRFVFRNYSNRMADFFVLVRELAFETLDVRIAHRLLTQADETGTVTMTHQALAAELGSTREVVSRRLKEFEHLGMIQLHRGRIQVSNPDALQNLQ